MIESTKLLDRNCIRCMLMTMLKTQMLIKVLVITSISNYWIQIAWLADNFVRWTLFRQKPLLHRSLHSTVITSHALFLGNLFEYFFIMILRENFPGLFFVGKLVQLWAYWFNLFLYGFFFQFFVGGFSLISSKDDNFLIFDSQDGLCSRFICSDIIGFLAGCFIFWKK